MNDYEVKARAAKVRTLVDAIAINQRGFDGLIAESLRNWSRDDWATLGKRLGLRSAPSDTTIEIVISIFDDRERRASAQRTTNESAEALPF